MCVKVSLFVLFLCFFMHAYTTTPSTPVSHNKKREAKLEFKKFGGNRRFTFEHNMPSQSSTEEICKTDKAIKGGASTADCKSSLHKALLQFTKPEDSRRRPLHVHVNVREMDSKYSSIFSDEELSATDYQPPHRKSPIHNK